jgi:hypothetical protein
MSTTAPVVPAAARTRENLGRSRPLLGKGIHAASMIASDREPWEANDMKVQ